MPRMRPDLPRRQDAPTRQVTRKRQVPVMVLAMIGMLGGLTSHANADSDQQKGNALSQPNVAACSARYPLVAALTPAAGVTPPERAIEAGYQAEKHWGLDHNVTLLSPAETGLTEAGLRVLYPAGTSAPSDQGKGGAGFYARVGQLQGAEHACLRYKVRFQPGFDFVKGGKLPGLYGGQAPSGGDEVTGSNGFSMRFMWRKEGQGELYEYIVNKDGKYGKSVGRGKWIFPTGRWVSIEQEIILNDPGQDNGIARVWIDGEPQFEQHGIIYRTTQDVTIDGLMFSTFFGGNGKGWRTPRDQIADFSDFEIFAPRR
ncbi:polysaccharide lyase [Halomonas sp. WWR20]